MAIGGGVKGQPVIASPATNAFSSSAWLDAAAFSGADGCAILNAAMTASTNGNAVHAEGLTGDQACAANPFPASFTGALYLGGAIYHLQSASSSWVVPARVLVSGMGRSTIPPSSTSGTTLQACVSGDPTCGANNFTSNTPLICFINCNPSAVTGFGFDIQVWQMTLDCNGRSGCIAAANYWGEENSGYFSDDMTRWGNGGVGLDLCGGNGGTATGTCQNSSYNMLNIYNQGGVTTCLAAAVGIRIFASGGPKSIKNVTISNGGCPGTLPNDAVQFIGAITAFEQIHVETFGRAGFNAGVVTAGGTDIGGPATQFSIKDFGSGSVTSASNDLIRFSNGSGASVSDAVVINAEAATAGKPLNLLNDQNNLVVPVTASDTMQQYMTGNQKQVLLDTTGTNVSNFLGLVQLGNTIRQVGTSVTNSTTTLQTWKSWTVPNQTNFSWDCKLLYNQTAGSTKTNIVLAVTNSGTTTFIAGYAEIFGVQGAGTPTMSIITASGVGVNGPTVNAIGVTSDKTYSANTWGSIEVAGTAHQTSTISIQYAAGSASTTFSIDRSSFCNTW